MHARQHRRGEVSRRRHDVGADKRALYHLGMDIPVVSARSSVTGEHRLIGRVEERPRAAGEIADLQRGDRVPARPIDIEARYGQLREQGRGTRERVEGREEFPVRDQALEHASAKIVLAGCPECIQFGRYVGERLFKIPWAVPFRMGRRMSEAMLKIGQ